MGKFKKDRRRNALKFTTWPVHKVAMEEQRREDLSE